MKFERKLVYECDFCLQEFGIKIPFLNCFTPRSVVDRISSYTRFQLRIDSTFHRRRHKRNGIGSSRSPAIRYTGEAGSREEDSWGQGGFRYMMLFCCPAFRTRIQTWFRDYDKIQSFAVILIYIQIGCALIGSLGALYNGVLFISIAVALFALVAIESSNQSLGRTYAVLLFCCILLDISWFILFAPEIWHISSKLYGPFVIFSVKLALSMQIVGFFVRILSSVLWIQMYRLGVSYLETTVSHDTEADIRNSFLSPVAVTPSMVRRPYGCDDTLGGSIYDPPYYSSLFEDGKDESCFSVGNQIHEVDSRPNSSAGTSEVRLFLSRTFQNKDVSEHR